MTRSYVFRLPRKAVILFAVVLVCVLLAVLLFKPIQRRIYPMRFETIVSDAAEEYDLPPSLIYAIIYTESKFDPYAVSTADAYGLMQITEDTYRWVCQRTGQDFYMVESLYDPFTNISCGAALICLLYERFENTETMLAAYNAGQGKVSEWLQNPTYSQDGVTLSHIPYEETEDYVRRVINTQAIYQQLYNVP